MYYAFIENEKINGVGQCRQTTIGVQNIEISEEVYNNISRYIWDGENVVLNPHYEEEQEEKRRTEFHEQFFNTSLGYIRRSVTMSNGSQKDFLSDLLPAISASVQMGQSVNLIAYDEPDFTQDVEDWGIYQHKKQVTKGFLQECFERLEEDFLG